GFPCALHVDPVEKKPLFHFLPGSMSFSLATVGCTLHCLNCQNWEISQSAPPDVSAYTAPPDKVAALAESYHCASVAYTYTDPAAFYEYALDCCRAVRARRLRNILVTAGYINRGPFRELCRAADAAHVDLKSMSDQFYRRICGGTLRPVLESLLTAKSSGIWVEVIHLVIPTLNDSDADLRRLVRWVRENLGGDTPLHFSRFFPRFRMRELPPTSEETLGRARSIALAEGLHYVYVGNLMKPEWAATYCPKCGKKLIERNGYRVENMLIKDGKCPQCGTVIAGVWS
ncbi:MAG: AmmeMemoRadiSam system radical SAM enzyme, partial [Victivallales bacterium]|nr:AmmeMemoRadiSam system radical SAM enzyme [Victivallales bacterium]